MSYYDDDTYDEACGPVRVGTIDRFTEGELEAWDWHEDQYLSEVQTDDTAIEAAYESDVLPTLSLDDQAAYWESKLGLDD